MDDILLPHNIYQMHNENNIAEITFITIMVPNKTRDNVKARMDEQTINTRFWIWAHSSMTEGSYPEHVQETLKGVHDDRKKEGEASADYVERVRVVISFQSWYGNVK